MKRAATKIFAIAFAALFTFSFSGCLLGDWLFDSEDEIAEKNLLKLVDCIENEDRSKVKALFSSNKADEVNNFESEITQLFGYVNGEYVSHKGGIGSHTSVDYGKTVKDLSMSYDVTTTVCKYRFGIEWRIQDDYDKDNLGIHSLYVLKFDDDPFKSYYYWGDGNNTVGINVGKTYSPKYMYNYIWNDESGRICFDNLTRGIGCGTLIIDQKPVEAEYVFGNGELSVSVFAEDLNGYNAGERLGVVTETVAVNQIDANGKLSSISDNVVLFGERFGKLSLSFGGYSDEDFENIAEWQYYYEWRANFPVNRGGEVLFTLDDVCRGYFKRRCRTAYIKPDTENRKVIFKWLPDNGFAFYEYDERGFVDDGAPSLAEGKCEYGFPDYKITFTKNELFNDDISGVTMSYDYQEIKLPQ